MRYKVHALLINDITRWHNINISLLLMKQSFLILYFKLNTRQASSIFKAMRGLSDRNGKREVVNFSKAAFLYLSRVAFEDPDIWKHDKIRVRSDRYERRKRKMRKHFTRKHSNLANLSTVCLVAMCGQTSSRIAITLRCWATPAIECQVFYTQYQFPDNIYD